MFDKIASFFRSLYGSISNLFNKNKPPSDTPELEIEGPGLPQDGSEIQKDTVIVTYNEGEVIEEPDDGDTETEAPETELPPVEVTEEETTTETPVAEEEEPTTETTTTPSPEVEEPPAPAHTPRFLWCLDNGHGKLTRGKRSPVFDDGETQLLEYEFNRDVVQRIMKLLDEKGVQYFDVVPDVETVGNLLKERVSRANEKTSDLPRIFVSVHSNAAPTASSSQWADPAISGIETWFYHNSKKGKKLASVFQKHLVADTGWKNRHIKSQASKQFYVLRKTSMPAILTENGFYNNKAQASELIKNEVRQKIAEAHVKAIMEIEKEGLQAL